MILQQAWAAWGDFWMLGRPGWGHADEGGQETLVEREEALGFDHVTERSDHAA